MDASMAASTSYGPVAQTTFQPQQTQGFVLCCLCGTSIQSNPSNMCVNCIRSQVDIAEGIQKQVTILWCKECNRYLQPPRHWVAAELESKELLTFCIKKIRGLNKVKLVDAGFIWTEPHSKRIKVKLTIQAEVFNGAILQQSFVVDYVVESNMCMDCNRANANPNSWVSCVQLRQHVYHKRTFLFLEQLILKHGADASCIKVKAMHEGVDFFFASRAHALKFIDFLQCVVPIRYRADKQLISHDTKSNTYNYKYTFSAEIAQLCKDDLVCLPAKAAASHGHLGPVVLVTRVTNQLTLMDPTNLRSISMDAPVYYRHDYKALATPKQLTQYIVLDIELVPGQTNGRWALAEAQVARMADFGKNDTVYHTRTHLGNILKPGDTAMGYDLGNAQLVTLDYEAYVAKGGQVPDVILVKKSYEEKRRKKAAKGKGGYRHWKLKALPMEVEDAATGPRGRNEDATEAEREAFLNELEEDPEMRQRINIYKDQEAIAAMQARQAQAAATGPAMVEDTEDEDDDGEELPQVPLEELLDELDALNIQEGADAADDLASGAYGDGEGEPGDAEAGEGHGDMDMD